MMSAPKMKVLLVLSGVGVGGIEQVCVDYAKLLLVREHDVTIGLHPRSPTRKLAHDQGLDGAKMVLSRVIAGRHTRYNPLKWAMGRSVITRNKIDIIVMLNYNRMLPVFLRVARDRCPVVAYCGGYHFDHYLTADASICITPGMGDRMRQIQVEGNLPSRPIFCVPNPLSIPVSRSPRPVPCGPAGQSVTIGALGRLHHEKGFDVLLRAVGRLKEQGVPFRLVMGGDGPERAALQGLSEELGLMNHVDFLGWVSNREKFFDRIDIFCLPSRSEPFGLVVTEAMARGCPVIVSDTEGPLTIVDNEVTGLIVKTGVVDVWVAALRRLIEDPSLAARLASAGQASAEQSFGGEVVGERLETVLATIIGDYRKDRR